MQVVNLGNFGQPRKSILSGANEAIQNGLRTGTEQGKAVASINSSNQELKIRHAELSRQLEKDEFEKEQKMAEHGLVVADSLSSRLDSMDPQMKAVTLQSPSIKAVTDGLKKTNPELFDETGNYVGRSTKQRIETQIQNQRQQAINNVKMLSDKYQKEGSLSPEEDRALKSNLLVSKIYHNSNMDDLTGFLETNMSNQTHPEEVKKGFMELPFMKNMFGSVAKANPAALALGNQPMQRQAAPPQDAVETDDPLSARGV